MRGRTPQPLGILVITALLAGVAGALAVWVLIGIALVVDQGRAVQTALRDTATLASTLRESLDRRIEAIDARLRFAQDLFARDPERFAFGAWAGIDPAGHDIVQGMVLDHEGRVRLGSGRGALSVGGAADLAARPDLRTHMLHPAADRLITGVPVPAIGPERPTVGFSRPLFTRDGGFAGVVVLAVDAPGLTRLHAAIDAEPGGVALINLDGVVLARAPADLAMLGRTIPPDLLVAFADPARLHFSIRSSALPDGADRFIAMRRLETQPLVVLAARDAGSALAFFLQNRLRLIGLGVIISTLIALAVALVERKRAGGRRAREQIESLMENLSQGVIMADRDGGIVVANARAVALLGVAPERAAAGRPVAGLVPAAAVGANGGDAEDAIPTRAAAAEASGAFEHLLPDGSVLEIRAEVMPDGGTVHTIADATARRRARDALAAARDAALAAEAALAAAIDNVPQGILLVGADRRLKVINRQAATMLGLPADLARPGVHVRAILEWQLRQGRYEGDPNALADALRGMGADHVQPGQSERRMPDGRLLELRTVALPDGGGVRCYTDITERRRQERALEEAHAATVSAEAALSAAIENVPHGVLLLSPEGRVRVMNRRAMALLDLPPALAAPATPVAEILALQRRRGEFDAAPDLAVRAAVPDFASPEGSPALYEYPRRDGTVLEVRTIRTEDGGAVRTFTDVTERRRAEREMQAARDAAESGARARTEFLAVMSHEIRTPLNAIIGLSGLMQDASLPPEQSAHARLIREAGDHLLALVNDILDFSSLESGRLKLEEATFDPRAEAAAVIELLEPRAVGKGLQIRSEVDGGVPARVVGDPGRLRQVLLNLLDNAVKFTDAGTVSLAARCRPAAAGHVRLEFAVRDSGIGIAGEALGRLFHAFRQVDASTSRRFGGTGLGLAISRLLVERMGGGITVESEPGQGSTFRFDILLRVAPDAAGATTPDAAAPREMPRLRILLAEDNSTNRLVLTHRLQQMGHRTDAVCDGREALEAVQVRPYDLIIMDMMMPGMDGLEATRAIRALPGPESRLPIIGLTAAAMPEDEAACLEAGMDGYERKPIGTGRLRAAILAAAALREPIGAA